MPQAVLVGDLCSGHGDYPPRPAIQGSAKVSSSGLGVMCIGDEWAVHCDSDHHCHDGQTAVGSPKVFASGKARMRVGDAINCGSVAAQGSSKVFIG